MPKKRPNIQSALKIISKRVEPAIKKVLLESIDPQFHKIAFYQMSTGGKRLRPALAVLSCRLLGGKLKDVVYPAAGLEILHNYTLIIDDIIDHSAKRRGKPTLWAKYGQSITECIAIDYSAAVFEAAEHSLKPREITDIFARALKTITDGEMLDILFERYGRQDEPYIVKNRPKRISLAECSLMLKKKTASLFKACSEVGAICGKGSEKQINELKKYGLNIGMAFQTRDDYLDIFGKEKEFGKRIGGDIAERKGGNIVLLYALEELKNKDRAKIKAIMRKNKISREDIKEAVGLIEKTSAKQKAENLGERFIAKAQASLKTLPQNKYNKMLESIAEFILTRTK